SFSGSVGYQPPNATSNTANAGFNLGFNPSLDFGDPADLSGISTLLTTAPHAVGGSLTFGFGDQNGSASLNGSIESYSVQHQVAPVASPIVGAGLPGLLGMLGFGGWQWRRRKKIA